MNNYITGLDIVLIILFLGLILAVGYTFSRRLPKVLQGYFVKALTLKLFCGLGFGWVYVYYYGGGDTQMYFRGASSFFDAFTMGRRGFDALLDNDILLYGSAATIFTKQITAVINLFAFNSYWACTLIFAGLSFIGLWLLFLSFYRLFPKLYKPLAIVTLFVPGVVFWSSGIMKDSICMLFIGVVVYAVQNIFLFRQKKIVSAIFIAIGFYTLVNLKAYIAIALLLSIALYALLVLKTNIKNKTLQIVIMPLAAIVILVAVIFTMNQIGESFERYSIENLSETAQTYQGYHERISYAGRGSTVRTGSGYTLGEIDYNDPLGILAKFPAAVNVTFFRPYVWEVSNPVMLLSALESLAILIFTFFVIRKAGVVQFFRLAFGKKEVIFCLSFALVFGFAVGFTTYNFGSLVRYKSPCIPLYLIALVIIHEKHYGVKSLANPSSKSKQLREKHSLQNSFARS